MSKHYILSLALAVLSPSALGGTEVSCKLLPEACRDSCADIARCLEYGAPCWDEVASLAQCLYPNLNLMSGNRIGNTLTLDISQGADPFNHRLTFVANSYDGEPNADDQGGSFLVLAGKCVTFAKRNEVNTDSLPIATVVLQGEDQVNYRYHGFANAACAGNFPAISASDPEFFSSKIESFMDVRPHSAAQQNAESSEARPGAPNS